MISFHKSPFVESLDSSSALYSVVEKRISEWQTGKFSYVPLLLGIIRKADASELLEDSQLSVEDKKYYAVEYYRYERVENYHAHRFTHVTTLEKGEINTSKQLDIVCFDLLNEAVRIRYVLDALRQKRTESISQWLLNSLMEEPFKESNAVGLLEIASKLAFLPGEQLPESGFYAKAYSEKVVTADPKCIRGLLLVADILRLGSAGVMQDLPKAVEYFRKVLEISRNNEIALTRLADIYRKGGPGVPRDRVRAELCLRRAVHTNAKAVEARLLLGLLYCMEGSVSAPSLREGKRFLKQVVDLDKKNTVALNLLGDLSYKEPSVFGVNFPKAKGYFKKALKADSRNAAAKRSLEVVTYLARLPKPQQEVAPEASGRMEALAKVAALEGACDMLIELYMQDVPRDTAVRVLHDVVDIIEREEVGELLVAMCHH